MALDIKLTTDFGIDACYHKLTHLDYNYTAGTGSATLIGFVNAEARNANAQPIMTSIVQLNLADDLDIVNVYKLVKLDERFKKSKDC